MTPRSFGSAAIDANQHGSENRCVKLVREYIEEGLNGGRRDVVAELFSPNFRDHDPLVVPGLLEPRFPTLGGIREIYALIQFLLHPGVDFNFKLEDAFSSGNQVAYRLFGQGTIELVGPDDESPASRVGGSGTSVGTRKVDVLGATLAIEPDGMSEGTILGDRYQVLVSRVGIFSVAAGRLAQHWGRATIQ